MKRRAILEAVCRLRKLRDTSRNYEQNVEKAGRRKRKSVYYYAGMQDCVPVCEGRAKAYHESAHICWQILRIRYGYGID